MTTRGQINSNFYQIVTVDANGNPIQVTTEFLEPAGANKGVQFNDGNTLASDVDFSYDKTTGTLSVPNINSANITGNITNATHANVSDVANSVAGANVTGTVANAAHATVSDSANTVAGANVTGTVANAAHATVSNSANSVAGANVTGIVANANYASYSSNSNSVNATISNVTITGGSANYLLSTNGSGTLSWVAPPSASSIINGTSNVSIPSTNGNATITIGGVSNVVVVSSTGITTTGDVTANAFYGNVYGNIVGNIVVPGVNTSVIFNTDGNADGASNFLFDKVANTLFVPIANVTDLNASGNAIINGNLTVNGNTYYTNVDTLYVEDPIIEQGGGPNGAPLTSNDGKDRGSLLHYYTTEPVDAFMGWDNSGGEFIFGANVTNVNEVITVNTYGNIHVRDSYQDLMALNTSTSLTATTGQMTWNSVDGTVNLGMYNGVTQQIGEELYFYGKADLAITNGQAVMFAGTQGDHILMKPVDVTTVGFIPEYVIGIATQDINAGSFGYVTWFGKVNEVDTGSFSTGDLLWINPAVIGGLTNVEPTAPNVKILMAAVIKQETSGPANNGILLVRPTYSKELGDLQDVLISSPAVNQALMYDNANSVWVNKVVDYINASNANVKITGGSSGNVLITDGAGNLTWGTAGATPGGANTNLQFNDNGDLGGISTVTWDGSKLSLGNIANILIDGGSSNYFARTDGAGNLSWLPLSSNLTVGTRTVAVNVPINNYQMNVEARSGNVVVNVN